MKNSTACTPSKCRTVGVHAGESEQLKAHVHPNDFARLCFCFETIHGVLIGFHFCEALRWRHKNDCEGDQLFSRLTEAYRDSIKEACKTLILFQMEEDISPTSLNATGESSSKFKLVVNAYGCFVESDEYNEGHKITKRLSTRWDFPEAPFDCEMFWFLNLLFCVNS